MRSREEIEADINKANVITGDLQYRIAAFQQQLNLMNGELGKLHKEMIDLEENHDKMKSHAEVIKELVGEPDLNAPAALEVVRGEG